MGGGIGIVSRGFTERPFTDLGEAVMFHHVGEVEVVMFPITPMHFDIDFTLGVDTIIVVQVIVIEDLCYFQFDFSLFGHWVIPWVGKN